MFCDKQAAHFNSQIMIHVAEVVQTSYRAKEWELEEDVRNYTSTSSGNVSGLCVCKTHRLDDSVSSAYLQNSPLAGL